MLPVKVRLYAMTLLILMMLSAISETSELAVLCICAIIIQRHHVSPVTINPCASLFSLSYSPVHDFQLSNILSVHFACTYLSLQGIHFRHLVVWSPLAPMSLPVTRFFVTAKGRTQGLCGNRSNPNASSSPLKTLSLLGPPDCSAPSPFWQLQQRRKPGGKVAGGAADSTYHHQLTTGDWFSVRFVQKIK